MNHTRSIIRQPASQQSIRPSCRFDCSFQGDYYSKAVVASAPAAAATTPIPSWYGILLVLFCSNAAVDFAEDADVAIVSNRIALHSCTGVNRIFVQCDVYRSLGVSRSRHQSPCIRSAISFASEISSFS